MTFIEAMHTNKPFRRCDSKSGMIYQFSPHNAFLYYWFDDGNKSIASVVTTDELLAHYEVVPGA